MIAAILRGSLYSMYQPVDNKAPILHAVVWKTWRTCIQKRFVAQNPVGFLEQLIVGRQHLLADFKAKPRVVIILRPRHDCKFTQIASCLVLGNDESQQISGHGWRGFKMIHIIYIARWELQNKRSRSSRSPIYVCGLILTLRVWFCLDVYYLWK